MREQEYTEHKAATIEAVLESDTQTFSELLANPDLTQEQRWELLIEIVDQKTNGEEDTFFKNAVAEGNLEMVDGIFSTPGLSQDNKYNLLIRLVNQDEEGCSIIAIAADKQDRDMVECLVEQTKTLSDAQRFELLKNIHDAMYHQTCLDNLSYYAGYKDEEEETEREYMLERNAIVQVVLKSCSDISLDKKLEVFYPHYKETPAVELIKAARYNDTESMQAIIFSLNLTSPDIIAVFNTSIEKEPAQDTILIAAVRNGHIGVVEAIFNFAFMTVEQRSKIIAIQNASDETALSIASENKDIPILNKILFNIEADQEFVLTDAILQNVQLLVIEFARNGNTDDLYSIILSNTLLAHISRTNLIQVENREGETALSIAIKNNDVIFIRKILLGLNINEEFELCSVALKIAQEENKSEIIKILKKQLWYNSYKKCLVVPDLNSQDLYQLLTQFRGVASPVFMGGIFSQYINIEIVEKIVAQIQVLSDEQKLNILNPDLILPLIGKIELPILRVLLKSCANHYLNEDIALYAEVFKKAIRYSAYNNDIETCQLILKDLRFNSEYIMLFLDQDRAQESHSALTAAVANGSKESVALILESVNPQQRLILLNQQFNNETVFMLADKEQEMCADLLNLLSAQLHSCHSEKNEQGQTLLIASAMSGNLPIVKLLFNSKISSTESNFLRLSTELLTQSFSGKTTIMLATENGHTQIVDALLQALETTLAGLLTAQFVAASTRLELCKALISVVPDEQRLNILNPTFLLSIVEKVNTSTLIVLLESFFGFCFTQNLGLYTEAFKKALIFAVNNDDIKSCEHILAKLALNRQNIKQVLSHPSESMQLEKLVGHTVLTAAVSYGSIEILRLITGDLSSEALSVILMQQVDGKTLWMIANENKRHPNIVYYLNSLVERCLFTGDSRNNQTLLVCNASSGNIKKVNGIFKLLRLAFHNNERRELGFLSQLFLQSFAHKTAIMLATEKGHTQVADTLLRALKETLVKILLSKDISENEKKSIFKELLSSVSLEIKFNLLVSEDMQGMTMFMLAVEKNYLPIAQEMLARLNLDQVSTILHDRNNQGHTALGLAKEHRFQAMVQWLENLSLRLAFNTHSATVHDSVARSVIALSAHYLALSQDDNATLQNWADSAPGASDDGAKKEEMLQVIHKNETQLEFTKLTQYCEAQMRPWVLQLNVSAEPMHQAAARGVHLIQDNQSYRNYPEPRIHVSLMQILALTWIAIEDQRECNLSVELTEQINNKKTVLIDNLFQAQRDSNLTNGKDLDPSSPDQPKCQGGFINNLMNALIGLHSRVKVVVVNKETVKLKGMCLVGSLFNSTDYTVEQVREIESTLEENSCLTSYVQENLKPQVEFALHTEFDDFVGTMFLKVEDIPAITGAVLSFQSANSYMAVQVIQEKLAKDSRMHPKPEAQPDDGQCEQANKKFRLG